MLLLVMALASINSIQLQLIRGIKLTCPSGVRKNGFMAVLLFISRQHIMPAVALHKYRWAAAVGQYAKYIKINSLADEENNNEGESYATKTESPSPTAL